MIIFEDMQQLKNRLPENKNILILSREYPNPYNKLDTPVIHYFAKEWKKAGYNVIVFHYQSVFPAFFYLISRLFPTLVRKIIKTDFFQTKRISKDTFYEKDNVIIYSFPIYKFLPHGRFSNRTIQKHVTKALMTLESHNFIPDVITGHFYNPQLEIITKLKETYSNARTCIVLHEEPFVIKKTYKDNYINLLKQIDVWGFRFQALKTQFEALYGYNYNTFNCLSGIPDEYIDDNLVKKEFSNGVSNYTYVGMLIPLKRVDDSLRAFNSAFPENNFRFKIIGDGMEYENLKKLTNQLSLETNVEFLGRLDRNHVQEELSSTDCFVMVSESEAFGLVYLEAMAKGCITIGTIGQGIDGVIVDGVNGFLCEAKNVEQLASIFMKIAKMTQTELETISKNAIETAKDLTDSRAAVMYLNAIME